MLMRRLSLLLTLPLTLAAVVFAVANRAPTPVRLWPFQLTIETPLFVVVLGALAVGLMAGALLIWPAAIRWRSVAKKRQRQIDQLEAQLKAAAPSLSGANLPAKVS